MDNQNVTVFLSHHPRRRSSSSDHRFSTAILSPSTTTAPYTDDHEIDEADLFYHITSSDLAPKHTTNTNHRLSRHNKPETGILSALPGTAPSSLSLSSDISLIPKPMMSYSPELKTVVRYSQSVPVRRFEKSSPVSVPRNVRKEHAAVEEDDDGEMLPPHEMVARGLMRDRSTTASLSVLEGVGRTLKGRDLSQLRNAVWRRTGFLEH